MKGLTAGAADPDPIPSRHAPRLRPRKAIVQRQSVWTIDEFEESPRGPLGALGGPLGASGEDQKQRLFSGSVLGWSWEAIKVFLEVWGDPWVSPARSECCYFLCFRRFSEMSCFFNVF